MNTKPSLTYLKECENGKIELAIFNELYNHDIKIKKFEGSMFYLQVGCLEVELRYEICSCHGGRIWLYQPGTNINIELSSTTYDESKGVVDPDSEIAYRIEYELIEAINSFKKYIYVVEVVGRYHRDDSISRYYFKSPQRASDFVLEDETIDLMTIDENPVTVRFPNTNIKEEYVLEKFENNTVFLKGSRYDRKDANSEWKLDSTWTVRYYIFHK